MKEVVVVQGIAQKIKAALTSFLAFITGITAAVLIQAVITSIIY